MKCPVCGASHEAGERFCGTCGANLSTIACPSCGAKAGPGQRFCDACGSPLILQKVPEVAALDSGGGRHGHRGDATERRREKHATREEDPPRRSSGGSRGCCGCCCLSTLSILAVVLLAVGVVAAFSFRVPQRFGFFQSPAERLLSGTPDRAAAALMKEELAGGGIASQGMELYVLPIEGKEGSMAYAVLDASRGFSFKGAGGRDPILDYMKRLGESQAFAQSGVQRVTVDYRSPHGQSLMTITATADAVTSYARGTLTREQFMEKTEGRVNWTAYYQEVMDWLQEMGGSR